MAGSGYDYSPGSRSSYRIKYVSVQKALYMALHHSVGSAVNRQDMNSGLEGIRI